VGRSEQPAVPLGSLLALEDGATAGRWPHSVPHALFFFERGLVVARIDRWMAKLVVEKQGDDAPEYPEIAAHSWPPDRILRLHPENRLILMTSVLEAHFRYNWLLFQSELVLTLTDASRLKFAWTPRLKVARGDALVRVDFPQEEPYFMRGIFGERLLSD
jgi:hypothetical protein